MHNSRCCRTWPAARVPTTTPARLSSRISSCARRIPTGSRLSIRPQQHDNLSPPESSPWLRPCTLALSGPDPANKRGKRLQHFPLVVTLPASVYVCTVGPAAAHSRSAPTLLLRYSCRPVSLVVSHAAVAAGRTFCRK